ncbi:MAG: hypothetical protein K0Q95_1229 [Bacteroidota bacterium]|jgi:hypothetical protein|nr:hypothetical protein [Bacteroidota bacterium]
MKKAAVFFLLAIFLFNTMGYFILFRVQQLEIKAVMKKEIKNGTIGNSVCVIVIDKASADEINWVESSEFDYRGVRYDILHQKGSANSITYYCIPDKKETFLLGHLNVHIRDNVSGNKDRKSHSQKVEDVVKISTHTSTHIVPAIILLQDSDFIPFISHYKFALIKASFQPPELA